MRQRQVIVIGLGSNLGQSRTTIETAAKILSEEFLEVSQLSQLMESKPWGIEDQPDFLNAVIRGECDWNPPAILNYLKDLETRLGRQSRQRWGPREIDLDLVAYGETAWESGGIVVPHPRMHERDFVLRPMLEVWPEWRHPILGKTVSEFLHVLGAEQR